MKSIFRRRQASSLCEEDCRRKGKTMPPQPTGKTSPKKCFGVGSLFPVQGMMKSDQYIKVLQQRLIPDMQKAFSSGEGIFQ